MDDRAIPLGRLAGVRIGMSWVVPFVAGLYALSLATSLLPQSIPGQDTSSYWLAVAVGAAFLFLSLLAHEMGHGFGFPHSSGPYSTPYDSNWDPMSNAHNSKIITAYGPRPVHTITHHKDLAEWIPLARKFTATNGRVLLVLL